MDEVRLSVLHRLWRHVPAPLRRQARALAAGLLAPAAEWPVPPPVEGLAVAGELSRTTGLGEGARIMLRALDRAGVPHWPFDAGPLLPAYQADLPAVSQCPDARVPLVLHVNPPLLPYLLRRLPRQLVRGRCIVGYWSWELPEAPADWRAAARCVHQVWVPSAFTASAIEPLLPGRVRVVPHPVAAAPPAPSQLDRAGFGLPPGAVVVLVAFNLASSLERKNPLAAIAAFRAAFGERPDRYLLLKIGYSEHDPGGFARIAAAAADAPNIRIETRTFPDADRHALIAACDIVLSPHRSEGFGLWLAEAMLLRKPVIATGWSGNLTFMDPESAALVGYCLVPSHDPRGVYAGQHWAEPDHTDLVRQLQRLADDAEARAAMGSKAASRASDRLSATALLLALRDLGTAGIGQGKTHAAANKCFQ